MPPHWTTDTLEPQLLFDSGTSRDHYYYSYYNNHHPVVLLLPLLLLCLVLALF